MIKVTVENDWRTIGEAVPPGLKRYERSKPSSGFGDRSRNGRSIFFARNSDSTNGPVRASGKPMSDLITR
jgi:hypothetical protein